MKHTVFITPPDAESGFEMAGVLQDISDRHRFIAALKRRVADPDTGLIIVDERLLDENTEQEMRTIETMWKGVLVVLPSPGRPTEEMEDYASRLIRRAIGYHVRLNI